MADDRLFLELRIHGVNNTKPDEMLGLDQNEIEMTAGDKLGSFWRPTADGRQKSGIRSDIEREAYSWGGMARSSLGGDSGISKVIATVSRVGWALLLPFGLVNVAYWTRAVDDGPNPPIREREKSCWKRILAWPGWGAATLRIAGLLITLLMAVTASAIVLDLVAVQCFVGPTKVCTALPSFLDFLTGMGQSRRLALLSVVPVALIAGLLVLSALTRVRYEQPDPVGRKDAGMGPDASVEVEAATAKPDWPLFSVGGFWSHRKITAVTARLHVAATATVVSIATAGHILFGFGSSCEALNDAVHRGIDPADFIAQCLPQAQSSPRAGWEIGVLLVGVAVLALIAVGLVIRSDCAVDVQVSTQRVTGWTKRVNCAIEWVPVLAAIPLFLVQLGVLASLDKTTEPTVRYLIGISAAPAMILTVLVAIGVTALLWRLTSGRRERHIPNLLALLLTALAAWIALDDNDIRRIAVTVVAVALFVGIGVYRSGLVQRCDERLRARTDGDDDSNPGDTAWNGSAPGVFLLLATLLAMLLSSAVAVAAGNWLNGGNTAASLADGRQPDSAQVIDCTYSCSTELQAPNLETPLPYMWFGAVGLPVIVLLMAGVAAIAACKSLTWTGTEGETGHEIRKSVLQKRKFAALAHRAERYVLWLAAAGTAGIVASIGVSAWGLRPIYRSDSQYPLYVEAQQIMLDIGMILLAAGGLAVIGLIVGGGLAGGLRPLGLAWDLMCFLPRAGHPLAPPCYAERAVPELVERCVVWLTTPEISDQTRAERRIVLSAHSLGSVLAVAVLLSPRITEKSQISLLTYGSQLRAYFSRIFPELLGPKVLGVQACESSSLRTQDPWQHEIKAHPASFELDYHGRIRIQGSGQPFPADDRSVSRRLSEKGRIRWRSLWRRADYLGFPVLGYADNPIDRAAEEVVRLDYLAEIQTHSSYPRTQAYWTAVVDLLPAAPPSAGQTDVT